jgi:hypothetical protein
MADTREHSGANDKQLVRLANLVERTVCAPLVLVMEYNGLFGRERAVTVPDPPRQTVGPKVHGGASLAALEKLARAKGYGLVECEDTGANAFFLRDDLALDVPRLTAEQALRAQLASYDPVGDRKHEADVFAAATGGGFAMVDV